MAITKIIYRSLFILFFQLFSISVPLPNRIFVFHSVILCHQLQFIHQTSFACVCGVYIFLRFLHCFVVFHSPFNLCICFCFVISILCILFIKTEKKNKQNKKFKWKEKSRKWIMSMRLSECWWCPLTINTQPTTYYIMENYHNFYCFYFLHND